MILTAAALAAVLAGAAAPTSAPLPTPRHGGVIAAPPEQNGTLDAQAPSGQICRDPRLEGTAETKRTHASLPCGIAKPVRVTQADGVTLTPPAVVGCATARALADWISGVLRPSAKRHFGSRPTELRIYGSYVCRTRNSKPGARISEHGRGRAIDIGEIALSSGQRLSVAEDWGRGAAGAVLAEARDGACGLFTTVLGPGSDPHHESHFHFDTARRRTPWCK